MHKLARYFFLDSLVITASLSMLSIIVVAQDKHRVVHILYPNDCPVEIRSLKIAEIPIERQKTFEAGEDWLKYLSWEIQNTWEKSAAYVEIDMDFHGLAISREESVFKYQYGQKPNASGDIGGTKLLRSGQSTRITISDEDYERIKRFIDQKQSHFSIYVVEMKVSKVVFEDGTVWPRR
jgi:hypothetical protein